MNLKIVDSKLKKDLQITLDRLIEKNHEIDDTDIDGEKVMMDLDKGEYFMMNEVGSRIWDIIDKPIKVNKLIEILLEEYEVKYEECEEAVIGFLEKLNCTELININ